MNLDSFDQCKIRLKPFGKGPGDFILRAFLSSDDPGEVVLMVEVQDRLRRVGRVRADSANSSAVLVPTQASPPPDKVNATLDMIQWSLMNANIIRDFKAGSLGQLPLCWISQANRPPSGNVDGALSAIAKSIGADLAAECSRALQEKDFLDLAQRLSKLVLD